MIHVRVEADMTSELRLLVMPKRVGVVRCRPLFGVVRSRPLLRVVSLSLSLDVFCVSCDLDRSSLLGL